jgi:hypothetical protein
VHFCATSIRMLAVCAVHIALEFGTVAVTHVNHKISEVPDSWTNKRANLVTLFVLRNLLFRRFNIFFLLFSDLRSFLFVNNFTHIHREVGLGASCYIILILYLQKLIIILRIFGGGGKNLEMFPFFDALLVRVVNLKNWFRRNLSRTNFCRSELPVNLSYTS